AALLRLSAEAADRLGQALGHLAPLAGEAGEQGRVARAVAVSGRLLKPLRRGQGGAEQVVEDVDVVSVGHGNLRWSPLERSRWPRVATARSSLTASCEATRARGSSASPGLWSDRRP